MAASSAFTPKASLTDAPTNLKEAIDWVLRVTGRDGKKNDECICGLAAAVTDLLQSVQLEYNGYEGDTKETDSGANKGATQEEVTNRLNGLFSLVQGLGGTAVVRTYIDQLAQVLSALVGWSSIKECRSNGGKCNKNNHGQNGCGYLKDIEPNNRCGDCGCMKWDVKEADKDNNGHHLGRGCKRCSDTSGQPPCQCDQAKCTGPDNCKCALEGKCCKCYCKEECKDKCKRECSCDKKDSYASNEYNKDGYMSAYPNSAFNRRKSFLESEKIEKPPSWNNLKCSPTGTDTTNGGTITDRRHRCARILLGSVCLIWSGITYMYWTGKYAKGSPRWNNHILDGSGLDDGTLSQWLQALGFPKEMLNNSGPKNRLDKVITDEFRDKFYLGFPDTSSHNVNGVHDGNDNTAKNPAGMNYAGYIHTIHRDSFNNGAKVFPKDGTTSGNTDQKIDQNKLGPLFKLYILSCAYFTGLQKKTPPKAENRTPRTIREILYWLSALPYSQAYKEMLGYAKERLAEVLKTPGETESGTDNDQKQLSFLQTGRTAPITVHEYNLFAHFQAVTQYCPLVLIGIQGGLHSTKSTKEPPIHALYANTECHFTYPKVKIQAYNQVVHYIRALFYQLYFLRKQCAVKVTCGGKWRECRYGKNVVSKGVISWMCLGCDPMEHDRKCRVERLKKGLDGVMKGLVKKVEEDEKKLPGALKEVLEKIGDVVVQLGNAQEALEKDIGNESLAVTALNRIEGVSGTNDLSGVLGKVLKVLETKVTELVAEVKDDVLEGEVETKLTAATTALEAAKNTVQNDGDKKNEINAAHHGIRVVVDALLILKEWWNNIKTKGCQRHLQDDIANAIDNIENIVGSTKCVHCKDHFSKCGRTPKPKTCKTCHQQYDDGTPSPLQAFLEDRLPGFSCKEVVNDEKDKPEYPLASSHLGHCNGSGQCCPLPMGFRGNFYNGGITDMTGSRLYGILYFFSNENMMQSCVYTLVRVTAALSATTPQVLGDVFGFFRGGVGNKQEGKTPEGNDGTKCEHNGNPSGSYEANKEKYFCGWCASGLRDEVKKIEWIPLESTPGGKYMKTVGQALIEIKGDKDTGDTVPLSDTQSTNTSLSTLTDGNHYVSPLTGELYTAVSATFGGTYLSWVLYLSDALQWGLQSLSEAFRNIECPGCTGCDPNKCKKGSHGTTVSINEISKGSEDTTPTKDSMRTPLCNCQSIVSCTGVLPVLYRHGFSYGNPFNLEGYHQKDGKTDGQYDIEDKKKERTKQCHQFLDSLSAVIDKNKQDTSKVASQNHPLTELLKQVGKLQYDIRLPWIFVLTVAWLVAVLYLAFGAIWPLDWTDMRSHWLRGGAHQWQCMWDKVMTGRKGVDLMEFFGKQRV